MEIFYNLQGPARKELVVEIENITGIKAKYLGVPSTAYQIGDYNVSKDGTLSWQDSNDEAFVNETKLLIKQLSERGYSIESTLYEDDVIEDIGLTITVPIEQVDVGKLTCLLEAKGELIKKALQVEDIRIIVDEELVSFPWFKEVEQNEAMTYTRFISAICKMSKNQKRVSAKSKKQENEKYAFRCFLLRLGFIGDEFKADRKILLKHLTGSSAFRTGYRQGGDE